MFKSVFVKYMLCFLLIFVVSFSVLFFIVVGMFSSNERTTGINNAAESVKLLVERDYAEYMVSEGAKSFFDYVEDERDSIEVQITGIANCTNTVICIVVPNGEIVACNTGAMLSNKRININIINSVYKSENSQGYVYTGDLGGIFTEEYLIRGIELSTGDTHGIVFTCAAVNGISSFVKGVLGTMIRVIFLVLVAGMIGCYFISERITTPLRSISRAAASFAKGNFDVRVQVVGNDEIAELAATFNGMAESLAELEKLRSNFLANVSHDLRTPMTTISGFIDGILDGAIPKEKQDYYLNIIATEIRRLSRLVGTLLDISRIQAGDRKFNIQSFDICEKAREILIANEKRIDEKRLDVEFDAQLDNMFAMGDIDAVHQVLYNLVDNAIKFSYEKGKMAISIYTTENKMTRVDVYNEGVGIAAENLRYVFDRFYKADKSRGLDKGGVGLGLYISRTIMESQGGTISAESEQGKWCKFSFTLPTAKKEAQRVDKSSDK